MSKVCKAWNATTYQRRMPSYNSDHPITFREFRECPRKFLPGLSTIKFAEDSLQPSTIDLILNRALPYLEGVQKLDLSGSSVPSSFVKALAKDVTLLPYLRELNVSYYLSIIQLLYYIILY